ncbi:extracellular solute-binding protein [Paenibacillus sp. JNUCC31]|uniref:extracellular solute-binding protein n=1 Tax=Paenibacillus sp. JNUCC-31 TaxID=2777983 RepID=UPI00177D7F5E|nr:extracellular solute-binding protein [Paenibacillus sp. JNUCC-31]QOS79411.1 extracellular solute-binding protein [Paenibacillus sp. JNUCC-31]
MGNKANAFSLVLATSILFGLLLGCSAENNSNKAVSESPEKKTKINIVNGKLDPPVTLNIVRGEDPTMVFKNGETIDNNVHYRWAKEALGVDIKTLWTAPMTGDAYDTKLKLLLSSGERLPDVFVANSADTINTYLKSGKVLNAGEAFEKYASPTYKAAMNEVPSAWLPFTKDGQKLALPIINENFGSQSVMWIRQDWLDKLKLKAPTTIEELEIVMDAFTNQDPDGNGKKDTIALDYVTNGTEMLGSPIGDTSWIFGMFGAIPERWYPGEDGKLQYGSIQPGIKKALEKMREWKSKGYLPSDIALHNFNTIVQNVAAAKVGIVGGQNWLMNYPGPMMLQTDPNAEFRPYPLPEGIDGKNMRTIGNDYNGAILISRDISEESLQAFFHYMNTLYSIYDKPDLSLFEGFQEGYDYAIRDGKLTTKTEDIPDGYISTTKYLLPGTPVYQSKVREIKMKFIEGKKETAEDLAVMFTAGISGMESPLDKYNYDALRVVSEQLSADVPQYYQGPATRVMISRNELLSKMQMDTYTKIIYGEQDLDAFDTFVEKWKSSGGEEITEEVNEWYATVK